MEGAPADTDTQHQRSVGPVYGGSANPTPSWKPPGRACGDPHSDPSTEHAGEGAVRRATPQRHPVVAGGKTRTPPPGEEPHRPLPRPQLSHRLAPACVSPRPRWQRAKGGQRDSAWHKSCAEGRVGGREIKISQNCSRWTDGVVNYCPPRKTGADRSSHKQQSLDRNHLRYPSPWSPHRPTVSQPPPPPPAVNTHRRYPEARAPGWGGGGGAQRRRQMPTWGPHT